MHAFVTHATYLEPVPMAGQGQNMHLQLLGLETGKKPLVRMVSLTVMRTAFLISKLKLHGINTSAI